MKDIRAKTYPNARLSRSTRRTTSSCPKNGRSTLVPGCRATSWRKANTGNTRNAADLTRRGRKGRRRAPARNGSAGGRLGMVVLLLVLILRERAGVLRGAELSVVVFRALQPGSTQPFGYHDDEEAAHQPEGCEEGGNAHPPVLYAMVLHGERELSHHRDNQSGDQSYLPVRSIILPPAQRPRRPLPCRRSGTRRSGRVPGTETTVQLKPAEPPSCMKPHQPATWPPPLR